MSENKLDEKNVLAGGDSASSDSSRDNGAVRVIPFVVLDAAATFVAYMLSTWGFSAAEGMLVTSAPVLLTLAAVNVATYAVMHIYHCLWEYASINEAFRIVRATIVGAVLGDLAIYFLFGRELSVGTYVSSWAILLVLVGASRLLVRVSSGRKGWKLFGSSGGGLPRTLVVGAGEMGSYVVKRMLDYSEDVPGSPLVLVDDDSAKLGTYVHGVRVAGSTADIPELVKLHNIEQIVVAIPSATRGQREHIFNTCLQTGVRTVTLPSVNGIPIDKFGRIRIRDVEVQDLLARDEIDLDTKLVGDYISGRCVLVTGGGGSIGSELVRQLLPARPAKIVLFDIYENTTYELYHDILSQAQEKGVELAVEIGSITNTHALEDLFEIHCPQVVFHAAAHKHVPLMENNPREAIENNVFGTLNVVRCADRFACERFVLISTDKAVNPTNVMGATKRMCEMIVQYYAKNSKTVFTAVRFGNVLGSHGSVIPLFKQQIKEGGPVTVTHRDIVRYFMTIPEAARLVITAGALAKGGEIFILNMGKPVRIYDLAVNLIKLSGLKVDDDIQIVETGLRPGEKMYEELLMDTEETLPTENKDITVSRGHAPEVDEVRGNLTALEKSLESSPAEIKATLAQAVPTYTPEGVN